jgi:hypothetical protein
VGVVGLPDMVMIDEDYEMKLKKIKEQRIGCGLLSFECLGGCED